MKKIIIFLVSIILISNVLLGNEDDYYNVSIFNRVYMSLYGVEYSHEDRENWKKRAAGGIPLTIVPFSLDVYNKQKRLYNINIISSYNGPIVPEEDKTGIQIRTNFNYYLASMINHHNREELGLTIGISLGINNDYPMLSWEDKEDYNNVQKRYSNGVFSTVQLEFTSNVKATRGKYNGLYFFYEISIEAGLAYDTTRKENNYLISFNLGLGFQLPFTFKINKNSHDDDDY